MMKPVRFWFAVGLAGGTTSPLALRVSMLTSFQVPTKRSLSVRPWAEVRDNPHVTRSAAAASGATRIFGIMSLLRGRFGSGSYTEKERPHGKNAGKSVGHSSGCIGDRISCRAGGWQGRRCGATADD